MEGKIASVTLARIVGIQTTKGPFTATPGETISFHENGQVSAVKFLDAREFQLPGGDPRFVEVWFDEYGTVKKGRLSADTPFRVTGMKADFKGDRELRLFPDGTLENGVLAGHTECVVQGKRVKLMGDQEVWFYENGSIQSCCVAGLTELSFKGCTVPVRAQARVRFNPQGRVEWFEPPGEGGL